MCGVWILLRISSLIVVGMKILIPVRMKLSSIDSSYQKDQYGLRGEGSPFYFSGQPSMAISFSAASSGPLRDSSLSMSSFLFVTELDEIDFDI